MLHGCLTVQRDQTAECPGCPGRGGEASALLFQESALEKSCKPLPALSSLNGFCRINLLFLLNGGYSEWEEVSSQGTGLSVQSPWERQLDLHWVTSSQAHSTSSLRAQSAGCTLFISLQAKGNRGKQLCRSLATTQYWPHSCPSCPGGLC